MKNNKTYHISFVKQKETKVLTLFGWFSIIMFICLLFFLFLINIYPYLSIYRPIEAEVLVVHGWNQDIVLEKAANEFLRSGYSYIFTTGGKLNKASDFMEITNYAQLGDSTLRKFGIKEDQIIATPVEGLKVNWTYYSAIALKKWLKTSKPEIKNINIYSVGSYSRETRLIYKRVLGKEYNVGILFTNNPDLDESIWWKSSYGIKIIMGNTFSYLCTFFFFNPGK